MNSSILFLSQKETSESSNKRNTSLLLLALFCCCLISCSGEYNDAKHSQLKGSIKQLVAIKYQAVEKFGKIEKGKKVNRDDLKDDFELIFENSSVNFDEQNNMVDASMFDRDGNLEYRIIQKNDTILDMVQPNGDLIIKLIGDDRFCPKEVNIYRADGKLAYKTVSNYEGRKEMDSKIYDQEGKLFSSVTLEYEGDLCRKKTTTEIKRSSGYYGDSSEKTSVKQEEFEYNEHGFVSKMKVSEDGKMKETAFQYKYDDTGNWVERIEFESSIPKYILERVIEYN